LAAVCCVVFSTGWAAADEGGEFRVEVRHIKIHVNADGSSVTDWYEVTTLLTETGIDWYGKETVTYSTSRESLDIVEAYTEHPDGQRFALDDKAIRLVEADNAQDSGTYSDEKSYVLIFPNLTPGAQTHYRTRQVEHTPLHAGHYFQTFWFSAGVFYGDVTIELSHDPGVDLQIEVSDHLPAITYEQLPEAEDENVRYRFHYTNDQPTGIGDKTVSRMDISPYVRISSIPSMLEEAKLYQLAANEKEKPSASVRALAGQITEGITDPKDQARALYNWVATQIRYVGIYLGDGGIVPNAADEILRNRYGDCKDKSTLLVALLSVKGIEAESAMVNAGRSYTLPKLGDISPINHVITYLPDWDLYVDATDRYASFGVLSYDTSDKPTVLAKSERYHRTPKSTAAKNRVSKQVDMEIAADGHISGTAAVSVTGSGTPALRSYLMDYTGSTKDEMPVSLLAVYDQVGTGTYSFDSMGNLDNPIVFDTTFTVNPMTNFPGPGAMWMPVGLAPGRIENLRRRSPMSPQAFPYVCQSNAFEETYSLAFPETVIVSHLPRSVEFSEKGHTYSAIYSLDDNVVRLSRLLEIETASDVCQPGDEQVYNKLLQVVQDDLRGQILYEPVQNPEQDHTQDKPTDTRS